MSTVPVLCLRYPVDTLAKISLATTLATCLPSLYGLFRVRHLYAIVTSS